ncbi:MAG: hypothetical protein ACRD1P_13220, partial [Thermoanaerobaculia bacterium]
MNESVKRGRGGPGSFGTAAFFLLLVVAVYADPLFLRRNFAGRDLLGYNLPVEKSVHDAYARGRLPVWVPEVSGGRPLLPNPNTGAFYPVRPLLSLIPFPLAMRIYPVLHWALAGIGTILLLRSLGTSRGAVWIGAVTYAFSGVAVSEVFYSNYQPGMTLLPWILWAFHRVGGMATKVLLLSFLLGLDLLAGDVFTSGLAILCCLLWLALELQKTEQMRALAILGLSLLLASFLAVPQIVATALWIPLTDRAVLGMKVGEALQYSIHPLRLLEFLVPFPFGPTWALEPGRLWGWQILQGKSIGFFSSLYAGAFAAIALVETRRARLPGVRFARGLLLFGLAFSVLPSLVPLAWANLPFPLPLRYPEKLAVALVMALAILSGLALDRLRTAARAPRWTIAVGAAMAVAAACAAVFPIRSGAVAARLIGAESAYAKVAAEELAGVLAEAGLLWVATIVALDGLRRQRRVWIGISLGLLTLAPIAANRKIAQSFREEEVLAAPSFDRFLSRVDPSGSYRTLGETSFQTLSATEVGIQAGDPGRLRLSVRNWEQYAHVLWGRGTIFNFDYDHGDLSRLDSLRRIFVRASGFRDSRPFYGALALRWGIRYRDQVALSGYHRIGGDGLQDWDEHIRAFPDIRLAEQWREETSAVDALKVLPSLTDGEIVIESDRRGHGTARPGRLEVLEKTPERLLLEAEAQDPTWLFVIRGYWNYRTILLDGSMVDSFPAQLAFTALRMPAGRHRV